MLGYFKDPVETKKVMDEEGWLHTGDLGYYVEDGEITMSSRIKQAIRTKSCTLLCHDFEETLMRHPAVVDCAVVGVEHPTDNERPFAFVVKARDAEVTAKELIEYGASKDERYWLTGGLMFLEKLPYTPIGKICIRELKEMAKAHVGQ